MLPAVTKALVFAGVVAFSGPSKLDPRVPVRKPAVMKTVPAGAATKADESGLRATPQPAHAAMPTPTTPGARAMLARVLAARESAASVPSTGPVTIAGVLSQRRVVTPAALMSPAPTPLPEKRSNFDHLREPLEIRSVP